MRRIPGGQAEVRRRLPDGPHAGWLSDYARTRKLEFFFRDVPKDAAVLDVGCGDGWVARWAREHGWTNVRGLDVNPPADLVGDVKDWADLGLHPGGFDVITAFEVVEHGDIAAALRALLKPGGRLMVTTPVPAMDWACKILESVRVLQRRTSEHSHLIDLREYPGFRVVDRQVKGLVSQWAVLAPR